MSVFLIPLILLDRMFYVGFIVLDVLLKISTVLMEISTVLLEISDVLLNVNTVLLETVFDVDFA